MVDKHIMHFDIALSIIKCILSDIQGRCQMDTFVFGASERKDLDIQIEMFERWRYMISKKLFDAGLVNDCFSPLILEELKQRSLYVILEMREFYMKEEVIL